MINKTTLTILNLYLQANNDIKQEIEDYIIALANDRKETEDE